MTGTGGLIRLKQPVNKLIKTPSLTNSSGNPLRSHPCSSLALLPTTLWSTLWTNVIKNHRHWWRKKFCDSKITAINTYWFIPWLWKMTQVRKQNTEFLKLSILIFVRRFTNDSLSLLWTELCPSKIHVEVLISNIMVISLGNN